MQFDIKAIDAVSGAPTRSELGFELCLALGAELEINGFPVPALTAGMLCLLDAIDSPIIYASKKCNELDIDLAAMIVVSGKEILPVIAAHIYAGESLSDALMMFRERVPEYPKHYFWAYLKQEISVSIAGFSMLPASGEKEEKLFTFDAEWLAAYVSTLCPISGLDYSRIIWEMPIAMAGFLNAAQAKKNGVKGIHRPLDDKAIFAEIERQIKCRKSA